MNFDLIKKLLDKKKVIGIVAAVVIAAIAAAMGMSSGALKEAICDAPVVELPKLEAPAGVVGGVAPTGPVGAEAPTGSTK